MQLQTLRQTIQDTLMDYFDDETETETETEQSPFREVGRVGKMPIYAGYDYDRIKRWASRARSYLQSEGRATDETLIQSVDLDYIASQVEADRYDPNAYRRDALRESSDRNSGQQARQVAADKRERDRRALFYYHRAPVLATHDQVRWRGAWQVNLEEAPADADAVGDLAEEFDVPRDPRRAIEQLFAVMRAVADDQDRGPSTYELVTGPQSATVDRPTLDEAARFFEHEVPGVSAPDRCPYISWADAPASWEYLPTADAGAETDAEEEDLAHV
jgi:hypothetical protein